MTTAVRWGDLYVGATLWNPTMRCWVVLVDTRNGWWLSRALNGASLSLPPMHPDTEVFVTEATEPEAIATVESLLGGERINLYDAAEANRVAQAIAVGVSHFTSNAMPRKGPGAADAVASHLKIMHSTYTADVKRGPGVTRIGSLHECHDLDHSDPPRRGIVPHIHRKG